MSCLAWLVVALLAGGQTAAPSLDEIAVQRLLETGKVTRVKTLSKGVTRPRRVTLTDGAVTHDAVFQSVDEEKPIERFSTGRVEIDFRDSYHFNIAAYRLARAVGLTHMVPPCVERTIRQERGSLCWWVDWKWDEQMRVREKLRPPDLLGWRQQWDAARVFSALIDDSDRNQTNMLISADWQLWLVDFSRAFRKSRELTKAAQLRHCPRWLLDRMRTLTEADVRAAVGRHLREAEIEAVLVRRRLIVEHFDALVAARGEAAVLF
jgi:hypothetical protein